MAFREMLGKKRNWRYFPAGLNTALLLLATEMMVPFN
jgi:hypothetical protein